MIIHRGRGGFIAFIVFLCLGAADLYTQLHNSDHPDSPTHGGPKLVAYLVAAFLVWWLSPRENPNIVDHDAKHTWVVSSSQDAAAVEADPSPLKFTLFLETDSLFFISVRYWPMLLCAVGVILYFLPHLKIPGMLR
jgi:hypothetical protein